MECTKTGRRLRIPLPSELIEILQQHRAISGHATTSMQEHYSSVSGDEVRTGLAKVIAVAGMTRTPSDMGREAS